jgi:phenylacetic acid degradation operon negative regulatory protein
MSPKPHNAFNLATDQLIEHFAAKRPIHANSLILTIFGDAVCPYGGSIWLGSLIKLVEPLGINQRLVRTSVFRLSEKGILQAQQRGRRSYYELTKRGFRQFTSAAKRIYLHPSSEWNGQWQLLITAIGDLSLDTREVLRKELEWLGFSRLMPGLFAHPTADQDAVRKLLHEMNLTPHVVWLSASPQDQTLGMISHQLMTASFKPDTLENEYQQFLERFTPLLSACENTQVLDPERCFLVRTLLIHSFRRILLREPELPMELLPADSISRQARVMTEQLYKRITTPADKHFSTISESEQGPLLHPTDDYYQRFGGLPLFSPELMTEPST